MPLMVSAHPLMSQIDWHSACEEATEIFRALLRIDTTNAPGIPGNETEACRYLQGLLEAEGLDSQLLESAPGRGNLICRLPGDGTGGAPILLSAHLDVVPAEPEHWDHPPFGAEIHDGFIWGRGAIDMKNMAAMELITMLLLKRAGLPLRRDLIFSAVADEEAGCDFGSLWLAENHPELIRGEYAISEIGGFTLHAGGKRFYPVQIAEKGVCWITITARGTPGHGSLPNKDNPIPKIARAAEKLGVSRLPHHRSAVVDRFIGELAANHSFPSSTILRSLLRPSIAGTILDTVFPDKDLASSFDAMLHNTANPTVLKAGLKVNQVPGEASLQVDGRLIPGQTGRDMIREIEALIGPGYEYRIDRELPAVEGDPDDPMGQRIRDVLARHDPEGIPIPTMIPGFTDAKAYDRLGMKCWGFSPVRLPPGVKFAQMFHGHNERIPVDGFHFGVRALFDLVSGLVL